MRTPETIYVHRASIKFLKINKIVFYNVLKWFNPRQKFSGQQSIAFGQLKNQEQVKQLKKSTTIEQALEILSLGSVSQ